MEEFRMSKKPVVLMILDGFGLNDNHEANAVYAAIFIVNLLLPLFDGIAKANVSPFLIPLKTSVITGNG